MPVIDLTAFVQITHIYNKKKDNIEKDSLRLYEKNGRYEIAFSSLPCFIFIDHNEKQMHKRPIAENHSKLIWWKSNNNKKQPLKNNELLTLRFKHKKKLVFEIECEWKAKVG